LTVVTRETLDRLLEVGLPGGPAVDEALRTFADLRKTPAEGHAVDLLLARDARMALPEPLLVALASALVDRGEEASAVHALARGSSCAALVLRAELLARRGDVAGAVALVERVLLRDIDWPGARERHARWQAELGRSPPAPKVDSTTTLVTSRPQAPFRLHREIARGGTGTVYEAEDRDFGRRLALKVYHRPDRDRGQLLHEVRVAVELAGEGVVRVFDLDPDQGWIALEWARGGTLRTLLRSGGTSGIDAMAAWARPLAAALARVHRAGWVHHDIKPANVLLRSLREPVLADFGSARRRSEPSPAGSLGYVSPERLAGRASDTRDDVYGYGRILQDALERLEGAREGEPPPTAGLWLSIAAACVGPDGGRPPDGDALATLVDAAST
jgi:serine/threonine-protein kinase